LIALGNWKDTTALGASNQITHAGNRFAVTVRERRACEDCATVRGFVTYYNKWLHVQTHISMLGNLE